MPVNNPPYVDEVSLNSGSHPRGSYVWLKTEVTLGGDPATVVPPDDSSYAIPHLVKVFDPDGNDVTALWVTNVIDPSDPTDVYNATHPNYKGALSSPANIGLFADGLGHLALKILIPSNTELTYLSSTRRHKVRWEGFTKNGGVIQVFEETFVVTEAGILVAGGNVVSNAEVTRRVKTALDAPTIASIIQDATNDVFGYLDDHGINSSKIVNLDRTVRWAIVDTAIQYVFVYDASAGLKPLRVQEASERIDFAGRDAKSQEAAAAKIEARLAAYCKARRAGSQFSIEVVDRDVGHLVN